MRSPHLQPTDLPSLVAYLLLCVLSQRAHSLIIHSPDRCGGTHEIAHASAMFGPTAKEAHVQDVPLFIPHAQANGVYLRSAREFTPVRHPRKQTPHRQVLALLFGSRRQVRAANSVFVHGSPLSAASPQLHSVRHSTLQSPLQSASPSPSPSPSPVPNSLPEPALHVQPASLPFSLSFTSQWFKATRSYTTPAYAHPPTRYDQPVKNGQAAREPPSENSVQVTQHDLSDTNTSYKLFNSCIPLSVPADMEKVQGRVAVVSRGVCDFSQKVTIMQDAGAVAVIVVNFESLGKAITVMKLNDSKPVKGEIRIPSVMISFAAWRAIAPCGNATKVVFSAEGEKVVKDYSKDTLNWVMMRGMALWILCQCGVNVVRYKRRVSEFRARADAIASLPVDTYSRRHYSVLECVPDVVPNVTGDVTGESTLEGADVSSSGVTIVPSATVTSATTSVGSVVSEVSDGRRDGGVVERVTLLESACNSTSLSSSRQRESGGMASSSSSPAGPAASSSVSVGRPTQGQSQSQIHTQTLTTAKEEESDEDDGMCAICLEEFENGEQVRLLECSHMYHRTCIDPWLQSSSNCCPLCKRQIPNLPPPPTQMHYGSMIIS